MEKARTLVVTLTAWLSFLAALWLFFFKVLDWQVPIITVLVVVITFGFAAAGTKK